MRAGLKAAGRSAVVGGLVLAAIEGFNIALQRVLLPSFQQGPVTTQVDMLDPPSNSISYSSSTWDDNRKSSEPPPLSAGFDLDSVDSFDK